MSVREIPPGAHPRLGRVEGDLRVGRQVEIAAEGPEGTVVTGLASFAGDARILTPFECRSLEMRRGSLVAFDRLTVLDQLDARDAEVEVRGAFRGDRVEVGRRLILRLGGTAR